MTTYVVSSFIESIFIENAKIIIKVVILYLALGSETCSGSLEWITEFLARYFVTDI